MKILSSSMSNLDLALIENDSIPTKAEPKPSNYDDYMEMSPLYPKSKSEEKLANVDTITITDNATDPVYSKPKPMFKSRFRTPLSPKLHAHLVRITKIDEDDIDKPDSADK
jgi:hypothetical protein